MLVEWTTNVMIVEHVCSKEKKAWDPSGVICQQQNFLYAV